MQNPITMWAAILQANSTTKGFLPPRMTAAQLTAVTIAGGACDSLMVFDTTLQKLFIVENSS